MSFTPGNPLIKKTVFSLRAKFRPDSLHQNMERRHPPYRAETDFKRLKKLQFAHSLSIFSVYDKYNPK